MSDERAYVLTLREMTRYPKTEDELPPESINRPKTRAECVDGPRPCPYVSCQHHLYLDVTEAGSIKFNFPNIELEDMKETCALDVADRGEHILDVVGDVMNLTRERTRQIEYNALKKLNILMDDERFTEPGYAKLRLPLLRE